MTPLVFLYGVGGGHSAWDAQVSHFGRLAYACLAWDQPGYGGEPLVEPYSLQAITEALREQLKNPPVVLVGHSMGGFIAQEAYARHPKLMKAQTYRKAVSLLTTFDRRADDKTAPPSIMARMDQPEAFNAVLQGFLRKHTL